MITLLLLLMGYPVEIPTIGSGYDFGASGARSCPGFEYSGAQYLFLRQGGGNTPAGDLGVHALKSTDAGFTWTEKDASNHPDLTLGGTLPSGSSAYTVMRDGTTVYVMDVTGTSGFPGTPTGLQWWTYNLSTDTWGARNTTTSVIPGIMQANETMLDLKKRGTADYILYHSGARESGLARVYYATFNGTTFGAAVKLPNQTGATHLRYGVDCSIDAEGRTHFYYFDDNTSPGPGFNLFHVAMDNTGVFGSESVVSTAVYLFDDPGQFSTSVVTTGSPETLAIALLTTDSSGFLYNQIFYATAALNPSPWNVGTITPNVVMGFPAVFLIDKFATLVESGGSLYCGWLSVDGNFRNTQWGIFLWSSAAESDLTTWSPVQALFDPNRSYWSPQQIESYAMTGGVAFIGSSFGASSPDTDKEVMQFLKLAPSTSPPPVANIYRTGTKP